MNHTASVAQEDGRTIETMSILHYKDSLFPQKYEIHVKSRSVYSITTIANYLDVKGAKRIRRVKIDRKKRQQLFANVSHLDFSDAEQPERVDKSHGYYVVEICFQNKTIYKNTFSEDALPMNIRALYDIIVGGK